MIARVPPHRLLALVVFVAAALWVATGHFAAVGSETPEPGATKAASEPVAVPHHPKGHVAHCLGTRGTVEPATLPTTPGPVACWPPHKLAQRAASRASLPIIPAVLSPGCRLAEHLHLSSEALRYMWLWP